MLTILPLKLRSKFNSFPILNNHCSSVEEEVQEEGAVKASILDIIKFSRPEWKFIFTGFFSAILTGLRIPIYSLLCGQLFVALSLPDHDAAIHRALLVCIGFVVSGLIIAVLCFITGSLFGTAGERMSSRLRMAVFTV